VSTPEPSRRRVRTTRHRTSPRPNTVTARGLRLRVYAAGACGSATSPPTGASGVVVCWRGFGARWRVAVLGTSRPADANSFAVQPPLTRGAVVGGEGGVEVAHLDPQRGEFLGQRPRVPRHVCPCELLPRDRDRVQVVPNVFGGEADELADPEEPDPSLRGECVDEVLRRFEVRGDLVDAPKLAGERFFCHALRLPRPADRLAQPRASATNFVREKCAKGAQPTLVGTPSIDWTRRDMLRYKQFASTSFRMLVGYSFPLWTTDG